MENGANTLKFYNRRSLQIVVALKIAQKKGNSTEILQKNQFFPKKAVFSRIVNPNPLPTWNGIGKFGANNVY